jgi:TetR/AcrR family fatty acid metabolism transcriptional regulator
MKARSKQEVVEEFRVRSIREAALRVLSARGPAGATMREIAREAGVAKGTLYLYFKNRDELCRRTAEDACSEIADRLEATLQEHRPFPETLRALVRTKVELFHAHRELFRVYLAMRHPEGEARRDSRRGRREDHLYRSYLERLSAFLRAAMDRGEVRRRDPFRLALFLAEGINGILLQRLAESDSPSPEQEADWIVSTLLSGLVPEGSTP